MRNEYEVRESKLLIDLNEIEKYNEDICDINVSKLCELKENYDYLKEISSILSIKDISELNLYIIINNMNRKELINEIICYEDENVEEMLMKVQEMKEKQMIDLSLLYSIKVYIYYM